MAVLVVVGVVVGLVAALVTLGGPLAPGSGRTVHAVGHVLLAPAPLAASRRPQAPPGVPPAASVVARKSEAALTDKGAGHHGSPSPVASGLVPVLPSHSPPGWAVSVHHLASGGLDRYYLMARPIDSATRPVVADSLPVVVVLHGRNMTPAEIMGTTQFLGQVGPAIVVFPSGYDQSWNAGYCCGGAHAAGVNDVAFLRAVVAQVVADQPGAAPSQVYLAGYSNGGRMAYRLACDTPGLFAGVATVEAVSVSACASTTPVPLLMVASTGDPLLTIGAHAPPKHIEGHAETTFEAEVATWRGLDGCAPPVVTATQGDLTTQTWNDCRGQGRIEAAVYGGGSHAWFKGCQSTPSAQALVWSFFHHTVPVAPPGGRSCSVPQSPPSSGLHGPSGSRGPSSTARAIGSTTR